MDGINFVNSYSNKNDKIMEEIKLILDRNRIEWNSPIVLVNRKEVITLSPEIIVAKIFELKDKEKNRLISALMSFRNNRNTLLRYLNYLGSNLVKTKI